MEVGEPHEMELYTWKYVNKKGGPDKRFKDNRKIPIVLYEDVQFSSPSGLNELIQLSKVDTAQGFKDTINELAKFYSP
jgi:hypothetical protein